MFGLFSIVALLYAHLPACHTHGTQVAWVGKQDVLLFRVPPWPQPKGF
jgi:hypothetical protein